MKLSKLEQRKSGSSYDMKTNLLSQLTASNMKKKG